jgi:hypothetical protein
MANGMPLISKVVIVAILAGLGGGGYYGYKKLSAPTAVVAAAPAGSGSEVVPGKDAVAATFSALSPELQARYQPLKDLLAARKWKEANRETYLVATLKVAGPLSAKEGHIVQSEMDAFPKVDLMAINDLWETSSHNKFGFKTQEIILHGKANHDWKTLYHKLGWDEIVMVRNPLDRTWDFAAGKEPDWDDLHTGELPTLERGYNHTVSLDNRLAACGFKGE